MKLLSGNGFDLETDSNPSALSTKPLPHQEFDLQVKPYIADSKNQYLNHVSFTVDFLSKKK